MEDSRRGYNFGELKRPVLESISFENRRIVEAEFGETIGEIDVIKDLKRCGNGEDKSGKFVAMFGESLFHDRGVNDDDEFYDKDEWNSMAMIHHI